MIDQKGPSFPTSITDLLKNHNSQGAAPHVTTSLCGPCGGKRDPIQKLLFHCCIQIPEKKHTQEGRAYLASQFRGTVYCEEGRRQEP